MNMASLFRARRAALWLLVSAALALGTPAVAQARGQSEVNAALRADPRIWNGLFALAIAREVSNRCDGPVEARTFRGRTHVLGLFNHARGLGFSRAEIEAFVDDEGEKAHLRAQVVQWFAQHGLSEGSAPARFCDLGRAEIAAGTFAGSFLRAR